MSKSFLKCRVPCIAVSLKPIFKLLSLSNHFEAIELLKKKRCSAYNNRFYYYRMIHDPSTCCIKFNGEQINWKMLDGILQRCICFCWLAWNLEPSTCTAEYEYGIVSDSNKWDKSSFELFSFENREKNFSIVPKDVHFTCFLL